MSCVPRSPLPLTTCHSKLPLGSLLNLHRPESKVQWPEHSSPARNWMSSMAMKPRYLLPWSASALGMASSSSWTGMVRGWWSCVSLDPAHRVLLGVGVQHLGLLPVVQGVVNQGGQHLGI